MARLAICADDYGLGAGVDDAIAELAGAGRLSALSCLVDGATFAANAARLKQLASRADVGLHVNFTETLGPAAPRYALSGLMVRAYARLLDAGAVRAEIRRQLDRFEDRCGFAPHHVDGHQHVHQFPTIRRVLLDELERRYPVRRPWLRSGLPPVPGIGSLLDSERRKPAILGLLGARAFVRDAARRGFATNRHLLGVYDFGGSAEDYLRRVRGWLAQAGDGDLLMTHPARDAAAGDAIASARMREYGVLAGPDFTEALSAHGIVVTRLSAALAAKL